MQRPLIERSFFVADGICAHLNELWFAGHCMGFHEARLERLSVLCRCDAEYAHHFSYSGEWRHIFPAMVF
jgi:hypothetical protein